MSFMVSDSLKQRLDEKTFLSDSSVKKDLFLITKNNLEKIKFFHDKTALISFFCDDAVVDVFLCEKIKTIKFRSLCFKKLKLKQIVIKENKCMLKILCKENEIENNKQ